MISSICLGEVYCRCGIPMLKTRIQLPVVEDGQPTEWMRSLAALTQQYAEQTLLPAVCDAYEELPSVAEKMHFEPLEYRHIWQAQPHPGIPDLLTVYIETSLTHGEQLLAHTVIPITVRTTDGQIVRARRSSQKRACRVFGGLAIRDGEGSSSPRHPKI